MLSRETAKAQLKGFIWDVCSIVSLPVSFALKCFFKSFKIANCSKENLTEMFNIIFSRLTAYTRDLSWDTTIKGFLPHWFPFGWLVGWSASLRPCLGLPMCQSNVPIPISISDNGCHDNAVSIGHKLWRTCPFYNFIWDFWRGGCDFDSGYHGRYRR